MSHPTDDATGRHGGSPGGVPLHKPAPPTRPHDAAVFGGQGGTAATGGYPAEPVPYPSGPAVYPPTGAQAWGAAPADPGYGVLHPGGLPVPPGYATGYPGRPMPRNGLGTAGLVLGIIGVVFFWAYLFGIALNVLAIIFGAVGLAKVNRREADNRGSAMAGLVLGIIGIGLFVLFLAIGLSLMGAFR
ncbi:DUF4190 domain-containing protein [Nakamurella endophytica]|uniref:DUF4190 domain-containing protein n=1 Tax=Nakamurella endophytica TaxID=1748367 RepID=A0A917SKX1_9ACTN|nr:DUF4190 domain-containing protein [Nakamurella endophytica]GGL85663.1 hypothetical protein GCM10011594_01660 [Nakamurella endophytica]